MAMRKYYRRKEREAEGNRGSYEDEFDGTDN